MCKHNRPMHSRRISIPDARLLSQQPGVLIMWRPEASLPEIEQHALVFEPAANGNGGNGK